MQTKLTLRLDSVLIRRAKSHARRSGKSLSELVAGYFTLLDGDLPRDEVPLPPLTRSLYGALVPSSLGEEDYDKHLEEKYQ